mmetsp:Transcript_165420/g.530794  ORF Transcript_165420/g.530794 Transcript_165420/m.530794 type:complete len:102 (-) Transcript_165420:1895-2200(-)
MARHRGAIQLSTCIARILASVLATLAAAMAEGHRLFRAAQTTSKATAEAPTKNLAQSPLEAFAGSTPAAVVGLGGVALEEEDMTANSGGSSVIGPADPATG